MSNAIEVRSLVKAFKLPHKEIKSLKQLFINIGKHGGSDTRRVLNDISFSIKEGEFFGIVGRNGSGKSTLLKLLAGVYMPTEGTIKINGHLTPFIELGVGFNPELSGKDNVYLNGALLGFSRKQITAMYEEIVSFAELDEFMDVKLKNYSSGMQVRLAFSIAIKAESDILLIDEVLAVGDALFQQKCFNYFKELKRKKKTVVFVSHDIGALQEYCDSGVLIEDGHIIAAGKIDYVTNEYIDVLNKKEVASGEKEAEKASKIDKNEWGTKEAVVASIKTHTRASTVKKLVYNDKDEHIYVTVQYKATAPVDQPIYGITIKDASGTHIFQSNTHWNKQKTKSLKAGQTATAVWKIPNYFNTGNYSIAPAVASSDAVTMYNWVEDMATFKVRKQLPSTAVINVEHDISVK